MSVKLSTQTFAKYVRQLLEASLEQLVGMEASELPRSLELYRQVLVNFLNGNLPALSALQERIHAESADWKNTFPELELFTELRRLFLVRALSSEEILRLGESAPASNSIWRGEFNMLVAAAWEYSDCFPEAIENYREASRSFSKHGMQGKSLRARFNAVTLEGHIDPERRLIQEYFFLYREARKLKQFVVMSAALLNISREYQKIGALKMALKFASRSVASGSPNLGAQNYYLALAHRAHVLFAMDRRIEAKVDYEEASTALFPAVQEACKLLTHLFSAGTQAIDANRLNRSWQERLQGEKGKAKFSPNEEKLLELVSLSPRTKFELMDQLFPGVEHFAAENRLKNLIFRIRRKAPGLLVTEADRFLLAEKPVSRGRKTG
jgi:tetratricopeptide (TPR) repeat protein